MTAMTLLLDEPSTVPPDVGRARLVAPFAVLVLLALVGGWLAVGKQPSLGQAGWSAPLDARQVGDGIRSTRYVLPVDEGEQVVLGSIRNDGRLPVTVLGVDAEHSVPWITATFRDRGEVQREVGYSSTAAAEDAVTASSVTLRPGASADVLVRFAPPGDLVVGDWSYSEHHDLLLSVRHLGVDSTQRVPLLQEPITLVGGDTVARLEREGRFQD
jgi:hypothetical protein